HRRGIRADLPPPEHTARMERFQTRREPWTCLLGARGDIVIEVACWNTCRKQGIPLQVQLLLPRSLSENYVCSLLSTSSWHTEEAYCCHRVAIGQQGLVHLRYVIWQKAIWGPWRPIASAYTVHGAHA